MSSAKAACRAMSRRMACLPATRTALHSGPDCVLPSDVRLRHESNMSKKQASAVKRLWQAVYAIKEVGLAVAIVMVAKTALADQYYVPSGSMEPTLAIGDRLLVPKFTYGYSRFSLPEILGVPTYLPA